MATAAELFASLNAEEPHIIINSDRSVTIPEKLKNIAVQYDHNVETVTFDCPRYWDGNDLSEMIVNINFVRPDKYEDTYVCNNVTVDSNDPNIMHFDWTISRNVTEVSGTLTFIVCVRKSYIDGETSQVWHSQKCDTCTILPGLKCDQVVIPSDPEYNGVQVDYNQNDETAPDYIKNRPFYKATRTYDNFNNYNYDEPALIVGPADDPIVRLYMIDSNIDSLREITEANPITGNMTYHTSSAPTEKITVDLSENFDQVAEFAYILAGGYFLLCLEATDLGDNNIVQPGLYYYQESSDISEFYYIDSINAGKIKKIDSMFIPVPEKDYYTREESDRSYVKNTEYTHLGNIRIQLNGYTNFDKMFLGCDLATELPFFDTREAVSAKYMYTSCNRVKTLGSLHDQLFAFDFRNIEEGGLEGCFNDCGSLVNINFIENSITQDINFQSSPNLSDVSIANIIDGLRAVTTQRTLTLNSIIVAKLTEDQLTTIRNKNWRLG